MLASSKNPYDIVLEIVNENFSRAALEEKKNWIQSAIKKKGSLHRQLGIPEDKKIPLSVLKSAAKKGGKLGKRARFALTLIKLMKNRRKTKKK